MPTVNKKPNFFDTDEGIRVAQTLQDMMESESFNTEDTYNANTVKYPTNIMTFAEKHTNYMLLHPAINPTLYLANLRLMTRLR